MITYSIIQKSQLEGAKRLDAEYYQPEFFIDFLKGKWQSIGDILDVCQYGISQAMNEEKNGYPIFRMNDIKNAFLSDEEIKHVPVSKKTFSEFKLNKNDVLFNRVNSEEFVGRTGIFKKEGDFVFASYLIRLKTARQSGILPDYLNIFLNSSFGIKQIKKFRRRAVNQANVNAEELKKIKIAILPLGVQKEIENLSNEAWKNLELSKSLYFQAENLLLKELKIPLNPPLQKGEIGGFESNVLSCIINLSDAKNANRFDAEYFEPKYEKLISLIRANGGVKLGDLVSIKKGIEPGAESYREEGKQFIRVSSLSKYEISDNEQKYLSEELYNKLKVDYEPQKGEILLTKDASPGVAYVLKENIEGIISSGILRLKLNPSTGSTNSPQASSGQEIEDEYLALCLNSIIGRMQAERDAGGSVIMHWKPEEIKNVAIPILPKPIQQKISSLIRQSFESRIKAKALLEEAKRKVEEIIEKENG